MAGVLCSRQLAQTPSAWSAGALTQPEATLKQWKMGFWGSIPQPPPSFCGAILKELPYGYLEGLNRVANSNNVLDFLPALSQFIHFLTFASRNDLPN